MPKKVISEPQKEQRKTLALALSGCSGRAIAYIGLLEVFNEHNVPIDMIAACSSGALVACAYASGNLEPLKQEIKKMQTKDLMGLFEMQFKNGILSWKKFENFFANFVNVENLEELDIPTAIVASDIVEGKVVTFSMGNILRAIKASCSMPGIFEPVIWGRKVLVDGGLFSIVPIEAAREFNPDVLIGVDMSHLQQRLKRPGILDLKNAYNHIKKPFSKLGDFTQRIKSIFSDGESSFEIEEMKNPSFVSVLSKVMDYAIEQRRKEEIFDCDLLIRPKVQGFRNSGIGDFERIYNEGRNAAEQAMPKIKELLDA